MTSREFLLRYLFYSYAIYSILFCGTSCSHGH